MRRRKTHRMRLVTWITDTTSTPNDVAVSKRKDYGDDWLKVVQLVENWDVTPMFIGASRTVSICNFYPTALNIVMRILQIWSDYLASDQLNSRRLVLEGAWWSHRNACTKLLKWDPGGLFTNAGRTYDTTAVVRRGSQLRYDLFTKLVASGDRIVRTIRTFADRKCRSITIVYISICGADR